MPEISETRVLVVDDDRLFREILSESLRSQGYHVTSAADGAAALATFRREAFEVVVTDLDMPRLPAEDFLAEVKASAPRTVVIAVATESVAPRLRKLVEIGCEGLLSKTTLDVSEVVRAIEAGRDRQRRAGAAARQELLACARRELAEDLAPAVSALIGELELLASGEAPGERARARIAARSLQTARQLREALGRAERGDPPGRLDPAGAEGSAGRFGEN